jgi:ketosteroid isomerase-like protein
VYVVAHFPNPRRGARSRRPVGVAMSHENVEIVRRAYEAWNAGDMDALREFYDPRAIIVPRFEGWPEGTEPSVGRDAVIWLYEYARQTWDADSMDPITLNDAGDSVVVRPCGVAQATGLTSTWSGRSSSLCVRARSSSWSNSGITQRLSKPWASWSNNGDQKQASTAWFSSRRTAARRDIAYSPTPSASSARRGSV